MCAFICTKRAKRLKNGNFSVKNRISRPISYVFCCFLVQNEKSSTFALETKVEEKISLFERFYADSLPPFLRYSVGVVPYIVLKVREK